MHFGHSHYLPPTPSRALNPVNFLTQVPFFTVAKNTSTPISTTHMCTGIEPSTGAWATYQQPHL